jgi:hypothetical protein
MITYAYVLYNKYRFDTYSFFYNVLYIHFYIFWNVPLCPNWPKITNTVQYLRSRCSENINLKRTICNSHAVVKMSIGETLFSRRLKRAKSSLLKRIVEVHTLYTTVVERLYCKRPILCLASSKILTPTPSPPSECVPPRLWCGGRTHSLSVEGVGVNILEDARHCFVLYSTYVSTL